MRIVGKATVKPLTRGRMMLVLKANTNAIHELEMDREAALAFASEVSAALRQDDHGEMNDWAEMVAGMIG